MRKLALLLATVVQAGPSPAQCLDWSSEFSGSGVDHEVFDLVPFDGELYAAGAFGFAGSNAAPSIARWDGTRWRPVGGGMSAHARALEVFDSGGGPELYACGIFTQADGATASRVARWDGLRWRALQGSSGEGLNQAAQDLEVFDDGGGPALYVSGSFTVAGGLPANYLARWDGVDWQAVNSAPLVGPQTGALEVFDDGSGSALYVVGNFANGIARFDGTTWSGVGSGRHSFQALEVFGGALYGAGPLVEKWDGIAWTTIGDPAPGMAAALVNFAQDPLGPSLYVGGDFGTLGVQVADNVARWDGASWSRLSGSFEGSVSGIQRPQVNALAIFGGQLHVGGNFFEAGGVAARHVARWDGLEWFAMDAGGEPTGADDDVRSLVVWDDGSGAALYAGGEFLAVGGEPTERLARWKDGAWTPFPLGPNEESVDALAVHDDDAGSKLYAGGEFGFAGGVYSPHVASWDGTAWAALGAAVNNRVLALAVFDPGSGARLYAGGHFSSAGGAPAARVASWDGAQWQPLGSGLGPGPARALLAYDDGQGASLWVGGRFTTAGGAPAKNVARWDGTSWHALGAGLDDDVKAFIAFDDGNGTRLYAGGEFDFSGVTPASHVAAWNGTAWGEVGGGLDTTVNSFSVLDTGNGPELYAFGRFELAARLEAGGWVELPRSELGNSSILPAVSHFASAIYDDGAGPRIYTGGNFEEIGTTPSHFIGSYGRACSCPPEGYCTAGTTGHGCTARMGAAGLASVSETDGFRLSTSGVEGDKPGLIFWGTSPKATPWSPASKSFLCVAAPVVRTGVQNSGGVSGTCDGEFLLDFNTWMAGNPTKAPTPGTVVYAQGWFRDSMVPKGTSLSDGVTFPVCP